MVTESARPETDLFSVVDSYARRISRLSSISTVRTRCPPRWACGCFSLHAQPSHPEPNGQHSKKLSDAPRRRPLVCWPSSWRYRRRLCAARWPSGSKASIDPRPWWSGRVPSCVDRRGPLPSQVDADAWINRQTEGLIARFPSRFPPTSGWSWFRRWLRRCPGRFPSMSTPRWRTYANRVHGAAKSTRCWWTTYRVP